MVSGLLVRFGRLSYGELTRRLPMRRCFSGYLDRVLNRRGAPDHRKADIWQAEAPNVGSPIVDKNLETIKVNGVPHRHSFALDEFKSFYPAGVYTKEEEEELYQRFWQNTGDGAVIVELFPVYHAHGLERLSELLATTDFPVDDANVRLSLQNITSETQPDTSSLFTPHEPNIVDWLYARMRLHQSVLGMHLMSSANSIAISNVIRTHPSLRLASLVAGAR